jgi:hypothetical protein
MFLSVYFVSSLLLPDPLLKREAGVSGDDLPVPEGGGLGDGIGPSHDVSFRVFDPDTNLPVAQVAIGSYRRTSETEVSLRDVTVGISIQGGAAAVITSPKGTVRVDPPTGDELREVDADSLAAADRARLQDVMIRWYATTADVDQDRPRLEAWVDNIVFDSSRLTVRTGDTTLEGRTVLGDDVPVIVRGEDLDFDGLGLIVEWDQVNKRPSLVQVPGGGRLALKNTEAFLPGAGVASRSTGGFGPPIARARGISPDAAPPEATATPYQLSVVGPIRGTQGGRSVLEAAAATGVVPLTNQTGFGSTASEPAAAPVTINEAPAVARDSPRQEQAAAEPIIVTWPGNFQLAVEDDAPVASNSAVIRLVPDEQTPRIRLALDGSDVSADSVVFDNGRDRIELIGLDEPVRLANATGGELIGNEIIVSPVAGRARVVGVGRATLPGETGEPATLQFGTSCMFVFADSMLQEVLADGDVRVASDRLDLRADELALELLDDAIEAGRVQGDVVAVFTDAQDAATILRSPELLLGRDDEGRLVLSSEEGVVMVRPDGQARGNTLSAAIDETADVPLRSLRLAGNVRLTDADGNLVFGDEATIAGPGAPIELVGEPARLVARPADDQPEATLAAERILFDPEAGVLTIPLPGSLTQTLEDTQQRLVTWQGSLAATEERIDLFGDVFITGPTSMEPDAVNVELQAEQAMVELVEGDVGEVEASGSVRITAEQRDAAGQLATSFDLRAARVIGQPTIRGFTVPVPGQLLVRDLRGEEAQFDGAVAAEWSTDLVFDPGTGVATLRRSVQLAIQPTDGASFRITSERFLVTTDDGGITGATATGDARLVNASVQLLAQTLAYDATNDTITATSGDRTVRVLDANGRLVGQFRRAIYDIGRGRIVRVDDITAGG